MNTKQLALLVGGVAPAFLFGIAGVMQKVTNRAGIGTGPYLMGLGISIFVVGALFACWDRDLTLNARSGTFVCLFGVIWAVATACIAIALKRYDGQIGQLVAIYNTNTLVAVVLGLVALSEWRNVQPGRLVVAAVMIVAGGVLAARS